MKNYIFILIALLSLTSLTSCRKILHGSGYYITTTRPVTPFTEVQSDGDFHIILTEDSLYDLTINAEDNILPEIITEVRGNKLHIYYDNDHLHIDNGPVTVYITAPEFTETGLHGSGNILTSNILHSSSIRVHIAGSGTIDMAVETPPLTSEVAGSGTISLMGYADLAAHKISGSGKMRGFNLISEFCEANISGSGDCYVTVNQALNASISGSGSVIYRGNPHVTAHVSGSGNVRPEE